MRVFGGLIRGPDEISRLAECGILVLRIGVNDEIVLTLNSEVPASGRELNSLWVYFADAEFFHILRLYDLTVFGLLIGARQ